MGEYFVKSSGVICEQEWGRGKSCRYYLLSTCYVALYAYFNSFHSFYPQGFHILWKNFPVTPWGEVKKLTIDNGQLTIIGQLTLFICIRPVKYVGKRPRTAPKKPSPPGKGDRPQAVDEGRYGVLHCRNNGRRGNQAESHCRERPMCRSGALQ